MDAIKSEERIIYLIEDVEESAIREIVGKIEEINAKDADYYQQYKGMFPNSKEDYENIVTPIRIIMSTYGGDVYTGLGLFDVIKNSKTPVIIECNGKIMSMGVIICLAAKQCIAHKHTTFMVHQILGFTAGKVADMEEDVEETKRLNTILFDMMLEHTSITKSELKDVYEKKKNWYMTADEALKKNIITQVIS